MPAVKLDPILVKHGSVTVKIYRSKNRGRELFAISFHEGGKRRQRNFADLAKARIEAKKIAQNLSTGRGAAISLTGTDRDSYQHAMTRLKELGMDIPLSEAIDQYVAACKKLATTPLSHAVDFYVAKNPSSAMPKLVPDVVSEFLAAKRQDKLSERYIEDCKNRLERFAGAFKGYISNIETQNIEDWLRSLSVGKRTRNNYRTIVATLFGFAKTRRYLPKGETEADAVPKVKSTGGPIGVFTPQELGKLLYKAGDKTLPAFALGAFAGLRQAEILRLNWEDIDFTEKLVHVSATKSKTGQRRYVPILPALGAWLQPRSKKSGRIIPFASAKTLSAAMRSVTTVAQVEWKHNGLRHSYASYRVAVIKDIPQVSLEMGNSPQVIISNYRELVTEKKGKEWFAVMPSQSSNINIVPISNGLQSAISIGGAQITHFKAIKG